MAYDRDGNVYLGSADASDATPNPNMYIAQAGNVGIGTSGPGHKLDVRGDVNVSGTLYMENGWELDGTSSTNFELDNGGTLKYRFNNGRFQTVHAGTAAAPTLVDNNDTTTGIFYPSTSDWAVSTDGTLALYVGASQGVGLGTQSIDTRQSEGLTISGTNITDTSFSSSTHEKLTSLFVPSLGSGSYVLAGIGGTSAQMGDNRAEPPLMVIGDINTSLHNNAMNSGRAISLVLAGTAGYNSGGQDYGNFGSLIFHGNSNWSGNARRWLISNAFRNSGAGDMGLGFAGGDSSAAVDPTISGSTPSVVMSTDSNYGVAGKGGLIVGNKTHVNSGKLTVVDSDNNKQLTLAHDGSNYTTFKVASNGKLTIDTGNDIDLDTYTGVNNFLYRGTEKFRITAGASTPVSFQPKADAYDMSFKQYDGLEVMRITDGQNVGIGVSGSIPARLTVSGTGAEGEHTFRVISGSSTVLSVSGANVGINTLTPKEPLHIVGDVAFSAEGSTYSGDRIVGATGGLQFVANGGNKMRLNGDGLGINTTSPGAVLHVSGAGAYNNTDGIRLGNTSTYASLYMYNSAGGLEIDSPHSMVLDANRHMEFHAGGTTREHRYMYATTQYGFMTTADANSYWAIGNKSAAASGLLLSGAAGGIRMVPADGNVTVVGTISATAKSFDIPHPDKEGMRLVHGSLEGPEHGVYARGTAKGHGETTIELPDYWKTLVGDDYTLQLTSYNSSNVYIVDKKEDSFTVDSNALTYKFDYVVIGRREEIEVEQDGN